MILKIFFMKVAMVYPEVYDIARYNEKRKEFPPFGVMYLSAMMENAGHDVEVFNINNERTFIDFRAFDAVGFSIPSSATFGITMETRFTSWYATDALIMVGGVHPNLYPEQTMRDIKPDVVGIGECESTILEILEYAETKDFSNIDGVCYWKEGIPTRTNPRKIGSNIDWLPLPARHLLPLEDIIMNNRLSKTDLKMAHVMFTRGCPFPCRFCAVAQSRIQYRSGNSARKELVSLIENYGIEGFAIVDDNFIVSKKKVYDVASCIEDLNLKWSALSRVDTVDKDLLTAMHKSGCIEIKFGMESGSPEILKAMRKNTTQDQIFRTAKIADEVGIKVKFFIVHGYPGENMQTTEETIRLLEKVSPYVDRVSLFRFTPLPGTYVYNNPLEFNLRGTDKDPDWDGDWGKYHIYHNDYHWWGTEKDFEIMNLAHSKLETFIDYTWSDTFKNPDQKILRVINDGKS